MVWHSILHKDMCCQLVGFQWIFLRLKKSRPYKFLPVFTNNGTFTERRRSFYLPFLTHFGSVILKNEKKTPTVVLQS